MKNLDIEYIYEKNNIIYADKKYLNNIEYDKKILIDKININYQLDKYKKINNLL
jgi:hypothetical protein